VPKRALGAAHKMGKGKDKDKGGRGGARGGGKQFSAPEEMESVGRQGGSRGMPPDDDDEEEEEDEPQVTKQNPNVGMMPPSDDDDDDDDEEGEEEDDEEDEEDEEEIDKQKLKKIFTAVGVPSEIRKELAMQLLRWKSGKDAKQPKKMEYSQPHASQPSKKQDDEAPIDPKVAAADAARLEVVRKRREESAKKRIAADGYDRMKPVSADNHPPGMAWSPPGGSAAAPDIS